MYYNIIEKKIFLDGKEIYSSCDKDYNFTGNYDLMLYKIYYNNKFNYVRNDFLKITDFKSNLKKNTSIISASITFQDEEYDIDLQTNSFLISSLVC